MASKASSSLLASLIWSALLAISISAWAHPSSAQTTSSLGNQAVEAAQAKPETYELKAQDLSAVVTVLRSDRPYPAGGSAFAQISLKSHAKGKKTASAELVLEAETAVIRDISGASVSVREEGTARIARVEKIRGKKPKKLIVELGLREPASSDTTAGVNRLKVTLRAPGASEQTTTVDWQVASCASGFYDEIVKVREGSGAGIAEALEAARTRDKSRPGRWLFPPRFKTATVKRKCVKRARRWDRRRGRYVYRCTKFETVEPAETAAPAPFEGERRIYNFAGRYVRSRAADRELSRTRDSGWATSRVSQNLQGFLKQDKNPALCTGVIPFFDYFEERMAGFSKRAETFDDMAVKSQKLAALRLKEAVEVAKTEESGHPAWGSAPLDFTQDGKKSSLKRQVSVLAQTTADAELNGKVSEASTAFEALRAFSNFMNSQQAKSLQPTTRSRLYRALSALEAADYISTVTGHYEDLRHALMGSMSTIRKAHSEKCTCGS